MSLPAYRSVDETSTAATPPAALASTTPSSAMEWCVYNDDHDDMYANIYDATC